MIKWWASKQNKLKISTYSLSGGRTQSATVARGAQSSERADSSAHNEDKAQSRRRSFNANNGNVVGKTAANASAGNTWCSAENRVSRRVAWGSAGRRAGLETGWACLLNTFPMGEIPNANTFPMGEIPNAKFPLVQLMEWPFQKLLHISSLWVLGLKHKFKRAGGRR